ncbi:MAG: alpha/beta hydrolase, partial [Bacilli bacterium]|nr:alpha/beta hydrolase [Bacilli bacterium]
LHNTIYIIDYPGFGKSKYKKENQTILDYANTIKKWMEKEHIKNPTIIAHSFGGRITTLLSGYYKIPIKQLILMDIASIRPKRTLYSRVKTYTYKILKRMFKRNKKIQEKLFSHFASTDYATLPISLRKTFQNIVNVDLTKFLKEIEPKTLIIWGEKDTATPLKDAYKIKKEIKDSELIVYESASHYSYLDYPYLTLRIIEEFLKEKET